MICPYCGSSKDLRVVRKKRTPNRRVSLRRYRCDDEDGANGCGKKFWTREVLDWKKTATGSAGNGAGLHT